MNMQTPTPSYALVSVQICPRAASQRDKPGGKASALFEDALRHCRCRRP